MEFRNMIFSFFFFSRIHNNDEDFISPRSLLVIVVCCIIHCSINYSGLFPCRNLFLIHEPEE